MFRKRIATVAVVLSAAAGLVGPASLAKADPAGTEGAAKNQNVRSALYYDGASAVLRKGIKKIKHPSTGIFCVKPAWKGKAYKYVPIVNVEVDTSGQPDSLAHWAYGAGNCPNQNSWFEVRTYANSMGTWSLSDSVSWTLIVP